MELFPFGSQYLMARFPKKSKVSSLKSLHRSSKDFACVCVKSLQFVSDSLPPYGLQPARLLCLWDSPGKNAGAGYHTHWFDPGIKPGSLMSPALAENSLPLGFPGGSKHLPATQTWVQSLGQEDPPTKRHLGRPSLNS